MASTLAPTQTTAATAATTPWNNNLGPLTYTFAFPPTCTGFFIKNNFDIDSTVSALQGQRCSSSGSSGTTLFNKDNTQCWPPSAGAATLESFPTSLGAYGFYSPGVHCPSGYTTACHQTAGGPSNFAFNFAPGAGETAYGCCPAGYVCGIKANQMCTSIVTTPIYTQRCGDAGIDSFLLTIPYTFAEAGGNAVATSILAEAPLIQLVQRSGDAPAATGSDSGSVAATSVNTPETVIAILTPGAIAGIVIGAVLGLALILIGAYVCISRRRQQRAAGAIVLNEDFIGRSEGKAHYPRHAHTPSVHELAVDMRGPQLISTLAGPSPHHGSHYPREI